MDKLTKNRFTKSRSKGFWMDKTEVTNEEFEKFIRATGYITIAERKPDPKDFPGVPLEALVAGSIIFTPPPGDVSLENHMAWWSYRAGRKLASSARA